MAGASATGTMNRIACQLNAGAVKFGSANHGAAAIFAIALAFIGKFGALLQSIPVPVMGGILCLLFGSIAAVGMNTLIRHKIDLGEARNLVIVSVTLVFGIGGVLVGTGTGPDDFGLKGIALCAVVAIALNLILPGNDSWKHKKADEPLI